nr:hypothetical protein [Evansella caseinilytica]
MNLQQNSSEKVPMQTRSLTIFFITCCNCSAFPFPEGKDLPARGANIKKISGSAVCRTADSAQLNAWKVLAWLQDVQMAITLLIPGDIKSPAAGAIRTAAEASSVAIARQ